MEISNAEQVTAVYKAKRRCEKELSVILKTLQKQLGDEQTRGAQVQISCRRQSYNDNWGKNMRHVRWIKMITRLAFFGSSDFLYL